MKLYEYPLNAYYHKILTIEADELTESLKDVIDVYDTDCYALCSSYCDNEGRLMFNVLAIGPSWEDCTRGLSKEMMLGVFDIGDVYEKEARIVDPDLDMLIKNERFLSGSDQGLNEDLIATRVDERLDDLRDPFYPDVVLVGFVEETGLMEYYMRITDTKGPFLVGQLISEPVDTSNVNIEDPVYSLPYLDHNSVRLLAFYAGNELSEDEKEEMAQVIEVTQEYGIDFHGFTRKS